MDSPTAIRRFKEALETEAGNYGVTLSTDSVQGLAKYYELLLRWNERLHLVAPCTPQQFATRHILESLVALKHLSDNAKMAEVGAGAGLPLIPCMIVRPDLHGVLIDGAKKKAIFLREAMSHLGMTKRSAVFGIRFEDVEVPEVNFVSCRALERYGEMLPHLLGWAPAGSTLLLFGAQRLLPRIESEGFEAQAELMPGSKGRFLFVVKKPALQQDSPN
jgi:16S rRNA (guanine527-N7)-methyltransferase